MALLGVSDTFQYTDSLCSHPIGQQYLAFPAWFTQRLNKNGTYISVQQCALFPFLRKGGRARFACSASQCTPHSHPHTHILVIYN